MPHYYRDRNFTSSDELRKNDSCDGVIINIIHIAQDIGGSALRQTWAAATVINNIILRPPSPVNTIHNHCRLLQRPVKTLSTPRARVLCYIPSVMCLGTTSNHTNSTTAVVVVNTDVDRFSGRRTAECYARARRSY